MSVLVHINGWPGTGKLTIARHLAPLLDARLLDNHTMLNPAEALFSRDDPNWWELRNKVRALTLGYVHSLPPTSIVILTDALAEEETDRRTFDDYRVIARTKPARLISIVLHCDQGENERRLVGAGRRDLHKLTRPEVPRFWRGKYDLLIPSDCEVIRQDVTHLAAVEAAGVLAERLRDVHNTYGPQAQIERIYLRSN